MRFNQVLRAARVAASVLCVLVAMLFAAVGSGAIAGEAAALTAVKHGPCVSAQWSARLGDDPPPPYYECYPSYAPAAAALACFQDAVECSGTSANACVQNDELSQCHVESNASVGIGTVHTGTIRLHVTGCTGSRMRFPCAWHTWEEGGVEQSACLATTEGHSIACGGIKRVKMKDGCSIQN